MKKKYTELFENIEKFLNSYKIFLFYGSNIYFMQKFFEKAKGIIKHINFETLYPWDINIDGIVKKLSTLNLFSEQTYLILKYFNLLKKVSRKKLIEFLKVYSGINYLFLLYEGDITEKEIRSDETLRYFFENVCCIEFPNLTKQEVFNRFIPEVIKLNLDEGAKEFLYEYAYNDLYMLYNELEKLSYFYSDKKNNISEKDVSECCFKYETAEIYQLTEAILQGDINKVLNIMRILLEEKKVAEVWILNTIYKFLRKNVIYRKLPLQKIYQIIKEIQNTDYKLKTSANKKFILESCVLKLTQIYNEQLFI